MLVIPGLPSLKAAQLLASDPAEDRVCEIVDLLVWGEADLRMSFELGGKPGGPAFGCADANKIDVRHMGKSKTADYCLWFATLKCNTVLGGSEDIRTGRACAESIRNDSASIARLVSLTGGFGRAA